MHIDDFLPPTEIALFAGGSGEGKTTLLVQLLNSWEKGETIFGLPRPNGKWGYVKADRNLRDLRCTADRVGFDLSSIPVVSVTEDGDIDPDRLSYGAPGLLRDILVKLKGQGVTYAVIDPLSPFIGEDLNRYHKVAPILIRLNRLCAELGMTLVGTHHTTKARSDFHFLRPQDRISGSGALSGYTSTQITLSSAVESKDYEAEEEALEGATRLDVNSHTAAHEHHWMLRGDDGLFSPMPGVMEEAVNEVGEVGFSLVGAMPLNGEPVSQDHLFERFQKSGPSQATLYRKLKILVENGLIVKEKRGLYRLPNGSPKS